MLQGSDELIVPEVQSLVVLFEQLFKHLEDRVEASELVHEGLELLRRTLKGMVECIVNTDGELDELHDVAHAPAEAHGGATAVDKQTGTCVYPIHVESAFPGVKMCERGTHLPQYDVFAAARVEAWARLLEIGALTPVQAAKMVRGQVTQGEGSQIHAL